MKLKELSKSKRHLARLVANLDGKYKGLNHKAVERTFSLMIALEVAARVSGYKSPMTMLKKKAINKTKSFKRKLNLKQK